MLFLLFRSSTEVCKKTKMSQSHRKEGFFRFDMEQGQANEPDTQKTGFKLVKKLSA